MVTWPKKPFTEKWKNPVGTVCGRCGSRSRGKKCKNRMTRKDMHWRDILLRRTPKYGYFCIVDRKIFV